jgi:hypothetical protein
MLDGLIWKMLSDTHREYDAFKNATRARYFSSIISSCRKN